MFKVSMTWGLGITVLKLFSSLVSRVSHLRTRDDDGYLILFHCHEKNGKSSVHVIDAKTMSPDLAAVVELPARVPYGFNAFFVSEVHAEDGKPELSEADMVVFFGNLNGFIAFLIMRRGTLFLKDASIGYGKGINSDLK